MTYAIIIHMFQYVYYTWCEKLSVWVSQKNVISTLKIEFSTTNGTASLRFFLNARTENFVTPGKMIVLSSCRVKIAWTKLISESETHWQQGYLQTCKYDTGIDVYFNAFIYYNSIMYTGYSAKIVSWNLFYHAQKHSFRFSMTFHIHQFQIACTSFV